MAAEVQQVGDPARWRTPVVVVASLAVHAALLGPLALGALGVPGPERINDPLFFIVPVELERRPLLPDERVRARPALAPAPWSRLDLLPMKASPSVAQSGTGADASPPSPPRPRAAVLEPEGVLAPDAPAWAVTPEPQYDRITRALRVGAAGCRMMSGRLGSTEQVRCDQSFATAAAGTAPIAGTGDAERDGRMAAQGTFALSEYDRRRAPLTPNSRARPCPLGPDVRDECAFSVQGRIWSNRDGWLPDRPRQQ